MLIRMGELGEGTEVYPEKGCNLIALATHGRGGFQRSMIGSITERVLVVHPVLRTDDRRSG
jgi:nucleotide-binding universal stress UspA family protein